MSQFSVSIRSISRFHDWSVNRGPASNVTPPRNNGLIAGLIKGNQWLIHPDHKAGDLFLGRGYVPWFVSPPSRVGVAING